MENNTKLQNSTAPQVEENLNTEEKATTPKVSANEIIIPVKFNKEVKELTLLEATEFAQKGLKFDLIFEDYENLKRLSKAAGKSVPEFLSILETELQDKRRKELSEKCGGNEEIAEHIIELEKNANSENNSGLGEIKKYFPEIKGEEDLPDSVVISVKLRGTLLLDEYLRYLLNQKIYLEQMAKIQKNAQNASVGSQLNRKNGITPEAAEFLKGLWK